MNHHPPAARLLRIAAMLVGLGLVLTTAACSSSKKGSDAASATTTPSTVASTTTIANPTTSVTLPAPPPPATPITIKSSTDGTSPDGSGCSPSSTTTLPDGTWFGVLSSVDASGGTIGLDLACWFTGDAANAAALADDPGAEVPVPDDYYVRNEAKTVRVVHAVPDLAVVPLGTENGGYTGGFGPTQTGVAAASTILSSPSKLVWVQVTDGWVTVVQAQFTP